MPIFISYSHADKDFATRLAHQLVMHKANVWIDEWELHVGDSLIDRIQQAIQDSSALLVILSKSFVESEWCKKELSGGLIRELEERRVVVLPVLLEDCKIPIFLKDKLYADFRKDFDKGLKAVLESIARVTSENLRRTESPEGHVDWAVDWGMFEGYLTLTLITVEQATHVPFTVLTEIRVLANETATRRYKALARVGLSWAERGRILVQIAEASQAADLRFRLEDEHGKLASFVIAEKNSDAGYQARVISRRLGEDTGRDILLDVTGQLRGLNMAFSNTGRKLTSQEQHTLEKIYKKFENRS